MDELKGLGILFVLYGHFFQDTIVAKMIYTFHIPLFFVLSGFFFTAQDGFRKFLFKKTKSMVWPYFTFGILIVLSIFASGKDHTFKALMDIAVQYILQRKYTTMWFLSCLFCAELLFYMLVKILHAGANVLIAATIISIISTKFIGFSLIQYWNINTAIIVLVFLGFGYYLKNGSLRIIEWYDKHNMLYLFLSFFGGTLLGRVSVLSCGEDRFDLFYNEYGHYWLSILAAEICIMSLIGIVKKIPSNSFLRFIGKNSIVFFALHQVIVKKVVLQCLSLMNFRWNIMHDILAFGITLAICYILALLFDRTPLKYLLGK